MPVPEKPRTGRGTLADVFRGQILQLVALSGLVTLTLLVGSTLAGFRSGSWLGWSTESWIILALAAPFAHQGWVWFWWRTEWHFRWPSRTFGPAAFRIYAVGFTLVAGIRVFSVVGLSIANAGTLVIPDAVAWPVVFALLALATWLVISIQRHFGLVHALGADHFFEEHRNRPLCRAGIFRWFPNAMYTVGFLALYAPAIALGSEAGLLLALYDHACIWVHYACTERPDLRLIYGKPD